MRVRESRVRQKGIVRELQGWGQEKLEPRGHPVYSGPPHTHTPYKVRHDTLSQDSPWELDRGGLLSRLPWERSEDIQLEDRYKRGVCSQDSLLGEIE